MPLAASLKRYGVPGNSYNWGAYYDRFDVTKEPNESHRFGWMVEIDPTDPASTPKKRTAMGRFKHEGAGITVNKDGRVVAYMGDDERFDYLYRFVSAGTFDPSNRAANMDLLDEGTLSVARFNEDGSLDWLPLVHGQGPLTAESGFKDQAEVLIWARLAGDKLGATKMDRPEDVEVNPKTGKVYLMLTNNNKRKPDQLDAANPRADNKFGHIVELTPPDGDHASAKAGWDILVKCGDPSIAEVGASFSPSTSANGWFGMPDNCAVDAAGRLWIATDGNSLGATGRADGIWALETDGALRGTSRLFFRVPVGAEMCGPYFTPDDKTFFLAVQHPGEEDREGNPATWDTPSTRWPDFQDGDAAAAFDRGHHQGGRRRHRRLIDAAGTRSLNVNFRALWCPQARRPPRVSAGGPAHRLGRLKSGCVRERAASAARFRSARGRERLRHGPENLHRLALLGVRRQPRPSLATQQLRVRLAEETQGAGDGDIGVAEIFPEPERARPSGPVRFQRAEHRPDLQLAALGPTGRDLLVQRALVEQADRLVGESRRQRADLERPPPARPAIGDQGRPVCHLIEVVQDGSALDQRLAVVEHQRRDPSQRVEGRDPVRVAEGRPRPMLERHAVQV